MTGEGPPKLTLPVDERDHIQGRLSGPVTLVEYGDYECPHCRQVHPIIRGLQERLGNRLTYVFRHFPLTSTHPNAQLSAEAAEAAGAQGKFWEMHDYLFEHESLPDYDELVDYAGEIGLDVEQFKQALANGVYAERVREDFLSGVRSGVNGTPTFFINGMRYDGPWDTESLLEAIEQPLGVKIRLLGQEFARIEASGGIVLLIMTIAALIIANTGLSEVYFHLWEMALSFNFGDFTLSEHLLEWVNDGLMVVFFFVVGLEIKREVTAGELADPKRAALPIAAAIGGMVFPAAIYALFNAGGPGRAGWGVPMATDIAFTLGILALLGRRVPLGLKVFFTALAIADDLGAVMVIALFYTSEIHWVALAVGAAFFVGLVALNRARVYSPLPYSLLGIGLWLAFLESGVHPTIAGVLLAMTIPTRSPANTGAMVAQCVTILDDPPTLSPELIPVAESRRQAAVSTLEAITERLLSPAQRLERNLHPWTTYLILPVFALANAGVSLGGASMNLINPTSIGIILGLVIGKPLGITLLSWLAVQLGLAQLPTNVRWSQLFAASWLAGIGFTMSLFIAGSAFPDPDLLVTAKIGILVASVLAGVVGWVLLSVFTSQTSSQSRSAG